MNKKTKNFNLVEIIIAMGIIIVCLTTVMGLFSAGIKISKDATQKSYANIILEQIVGMYDTNPNIKEDIQKTTNILTAETTIKHGAYYTDSAANANRIFKPTESGLGPDALAIHTAEGGVDGGGTMGTSTISLVDNTINVYQSTACDGLFKIDFQSKLNTDSNSAADNNTADTVKDFSLIARVWIETITVNSNDNIPVSSPNPLQFEQRLKVEISWPPKEPYMNRLLQGNVIYFEKEL